MIRTRKHDNKDKTDKLDMPWMEIIYLTELRSATDSSVIVVIELPDAER